MGIYKIKKGLDIPIKGAALESLIEKKSVSQVALLGADYNGLKPTINVQIGDKVKKGDLLFVDKKNPGVKFTAPASGVVKSINRGEKRLFLSLIIEINGKEEITFNSFTNEEVLKLDEIKIREQLIDSGLWTSFRTRPFNNIPKIDSEVNSIFVNAMDTNPLASSMSVLFDGKQNELNTGLIILSKIAKSKIYFCKNSKENFELPKIEKLSLEIFEGPHPAGLPGTHIHFIDPASRKNTVWFINFEDVINIGYLFLTGKINEEKIIALTGPSVKNPKIIKTNIGASLADLTKNELLDGKNRIISGSVLYGYKYLPETGFIGRYHRQISVIQEATNKEFIGWLAPASTKFSLKNVVLSKLTPSKINFDTALNGGHRAIVPIGSYEKVMPLDIIPTYLFRALSVNDVEEAEKLGCLELDEEDLALSTVVCPSKNDYGKLLRQNLNLIEKEG